MTSFSDLNLAPALAKSLAREGYTTPTPIQAQAIPLVLEGKDIMGIAQTGTGKTAAFALPVLDHIIREEKDLPKRGARVLVLAPTRELASQIAVSFRAYGQDIEGLAVAAIFGGVKIPRQVKKVVGGNDVLVATPGRLIDLIEQKILKLSDVEILILDEADQMMDMGFIHALRKIVKLVPQKRQTLFFSATMAPKIANLAKQFLNNPSRVSVAPANTTAERVSQSLTFVDKGEKQALLTLALLDPDIDRALVFTRTKHGADRVVKKLAAAGILAKAIHGNKSQPQRQKALKAFKDGEVRVMVATDIAARGIDIEGISHVFNYEIPNVAEQYVHRIGRTARAGREGKAVAYVAADERPYLKDIQKLLKMTIPVEPLPADFNAQSAKLKHLKPLPKPEKPEAQEGGKKKKSRPGKWARDKKAGEKKSGKPAKPDWKPDMRQASVPSEDSAPQKPKEADAGERAPRHKHKHKAKGGPRNHGDGKPAQDGGQGGKSFKRKPRKDGPPKSGGGRPNNNRRNKPGGGHRG